MSLGRGAAPRQADRGRAEAGQRVSRLPACARNRDAVEHNMRGLYHEVA